MEGKKSKIDIATMAIFFIRNIMGKEIKAFWLS